MASSDLLYEIFNPESNDRARMKALILAYKQLEPSGDDNSSPLTTDQCAFRQNLWQRISDRFRSAAPNDSCVALKVACFMLSRLLHCPTIRNHLLADAHLHAVLQREFLSDHGSMCPKYAVHILRQLYEIIDDGDADDAAATTTNSWRTFFVINDTLNDREVHLVMPVLDLLRSAFALPFGWRWVLLTKALLTSSHTINLKVLKFVIDMMDDAKATAELRTNRLCGDLFAPAFLTSLNMTTLYSSSSCGAESLTAAELRAFLLAIGGNDEDGQQSIIPAEYVRLMCDINWLVVPLYHIAEVFAVELVRPANREHLTRFVARCGAQPNVYARHRILAQLKDAYVSSLGAELIGWDRMEGHERSDDRFFGHQQTDSFVASRDLCDRTVRMRHLDRINADDRVKTAEFLSRNEVLDDVHRELCRIVTMYVARDDDQLPVTWRLDSRTRLSLDASVWSRTCGVEIDTDQPALRLLEAEFLVRSPHYAYRRLSLIALGLVRVLDTIRGRDAAVVQQSIEKLCVEHARLAILVVLCCLDTIADYPQLLNEFWSAISLHDPSVENLSSFMALLDEVHRKQYIEDALKIDYYELIVTAVRLRAKWQYAVICYMKHSSSFARFVAYQEDLVFSLLTYGSKMQGEQITEYHMLKQMYGSDLPPECNDTVDIRFTTIKHAILDINDSQLHAESMQRCRQRLRERCTREILHIYHTKPRHYANSLTHRLILRQLQVLVLLAHREPVWMDAYKELLLQHNHQPGVGHLLELLVAQTAADAAQLSEMLREANTNGARRSVMMCMLYMRKRLGCDSSGVAIAFAEDIMPYTMGKDFGTRLLAQYVCEKLLQSTTDTLKGATIASVCRRSLQMLDHRDERDRMDQDFRFHIAAISPVLVLHDVPQLTGICSSEWIPLDRLADHANTLTESFRAPVQTVSRAQVHITPIEVNVNNVQRKIVPLRQLYPEYVEAENEMQREGTAAVDESAAKGLGERDGLVVVASLLTKEANLGGLARTCEIFNCSSLVLANLKTIESREFQALSMTADQWLVFTEVKPFHLLPYLLQMRELGYKLIGAEQTANGIPLDQLEFPRKSLLLLGNEKQGIPADLLSVLDVAVEVPQFGVVRSLNVHVTGALFVWEYAKQHKIKHAALTTE